MKRNKLQKKENKNKINNTKCKVNYFKFMNLFIFLFFIFALEKSKKIYNQLYFKDLFYYYHYQLIFYIHLLIEY
jgi:hypothetical protein